jgi:hypothetical protein
MHIAVCLLRILLSVPDTHTARRGLDPRGMESMKYVSSAVLTTLVLGLSATSATAVDVAGRAGLGFTTTEAPVGGRHWANNRVGVDVGIGVRSRDGGSTIVTTVAGGVPIRVLDTLSRVNLNLRPGFLLPDIGKSGSVVYLTAQLEFEVFATRDFSVRGAYGPALRTYSGGPTDFLTTGDNLTSAGFFFYFE